MATRNWKAIAQSRRPSDVRLVSMSINILREQREWLEKHAKSQQKTLNHLVRECFEIAIEHLDQEKAKSTKEKRHAAV